MLAISLSPVEDEELAHRALELGRAGPGRGEGRCRECRDYKPPQVTEATRRWWLEQFMLDEIRELANGMFGRSG